MKDKKYSIESITGTAMVSNKYDEGEFPSLHEAMKSFMNEEFSFMDSEEKILYDPDGKIVAVRWIEDGYEFFSLGRD